MTYVFDFDSPPETTKERSQVLLGGKGHNLAVMTNELGLPVPPGFTITTEAGREYLSNGWPEGLDDEIWAHIGRLENRVGRKLGGPGEPLLVSVRSGASVSMPGMMDTILNLGLNEGTVKELGRASDDPAFAEEAWRRMTTMYRDIVGTDEVPDDPRDQLRRAIEAVFRSWDTPRARSYREHEGIPHDLGTAVTVQAMVFGNLDEQSATGVVFTRSPATGEKELYGDVMFQAQGEDVVSGTQTPEPISVLDERLPEVAGELRRYAETLERHYRDVCDIEFTIERARLWLLQVRIGKRSPQAALKIAVDMCEDESFPLSRAEAIDRVAHHLVTPPATVTHIGEDVDLLTTGLPASPGLASGRLATTAEAAVEIAQTGEPVILVRPETSPDDVHGMARVRGILTSKGGLASHAAVVARGWGIPAVVGADEIRVGDGEIEVAGRNLGQGSTITINGQTGEVFSGRIETEARVATEAELLLGWARELEIEVFDEATLGSEVGALPDSEAGDAEVPDETTVVRALHIKGFATPEALGPAVLSSEGAVRPALVELESKGLAKKVGEMYQLTDNGKSLGESLIGEDRDRWSLERANDALDSFLPLDQRVKVIVTAWQMREIDGEQVINDHSDREYDEQVISNLASVHRDAVAWLEPHTDDLPRLQAYVERLERAMAKVEEGDYDHIASPRIDSYHNVWFELHEDLILLADRTREEETEAGRA